MLRVGSGVALPLTRSRARGARSAVATVPGAATAVTAPWVLGVRVPSVRATGLLFLVMLGYSRGMFFNQNHSRERIAFAWGLSRAVPFVH